MPEIHDVANADDFATHLTAQEPSSLLVLYFHITWTVYRTNLTAELSTLASQYPPTATTPLTFIGINGGTIRGVVKGYGVGTAPSVVLLRDGEILEKVKGSNSKPIREAVERHTGVSLLPAATSTCIPEPMAPEQREAPFARLAGLVRLTPVVYFVKGSPDPPLCRFSRRLVKILRD